MSKSIEILEADLKKTKNALRKHKDEAKFWHKKIKNIHQIIDQCNINTNFRDNAKAGGIPGIGGMQYCSSSGELEQALARIIRIIKE
jgi:hypothetical protein